MANIFQKQITPIKPKVLSEERVYVYVPTATANSAGIASFDKEDFLVGNGEVSLAWSEKDTIESADPLTKPSYVKLKDDEFKHTDNPVTVTNPITGISYTSNKAEVELIRENRNAFVRPELVMLDNEDFDSSTSGEYNVYSIKQKDPSVEPTIVQLDEEDFSTVNGISKIEWAYAHQPATGSANTGNFGMVKVDREGTGGLSFDANNNLIVDQEMVINGLQDYIDVRPVYGETDVNKWSQLEDFYDTTTGLAKRDTNGNVKLSITKESVGLSNLDNIKFSDRKYTDFGQDMQDYFQTQFDNKLDVSEWNEKFADWRPIDNNRDTVQKWFEYLELADESLRSSITSLNKFLGFFETDDVLISTYPANATLLTSTAYVNETNTYWGVKPIDGSRYYTYFRTNTGLSSISGQTVGDRCVNLDDGEEYVWDGLVWQPDGTHPEAWTWYNTTNSNLSMYDIMEVDATNLKPNAPVSNISAGQSGKWIQSDHIHPSDNLKMNASILDNGKITITTGDPTGSDFTDNIAEVTLINTTTSIQFEAEVVDMPAYLDGIPNPTAGDLAVVRYNSMIYRYNGSSWSSTGDKASINYVADTNIHVPYVKTAQTLHNWKSNTTNFVQSADSNEYYWAGTKAEFENLDVDSLPNGTLIQVTDDEYYEVGKYVTIDQLNNSGITIGDKLTPSTDRFVTVDVSVADNIQGAPLVLNSENNRYKLDKMSFGELVTNNMDSSTKMVVSKLDANNNRVLANREFNPNRVIVSDNNGNLTTSSALADGLISKTETLTTGGVIIANGQSTVKSYASGLTSDVPIVADGNNGLKTLIKPSGVLKINETAQMTTVPWNDANLIKTSNTSDAKTLAANKLLITGSDNTVDVWSQSPKPGAMVIMGSGTGEIDVFASENSNRLLFKDGNDAIQELGSGLAGQVLRSTGENQPPIWYTIPTVPNELPQKVLTYAPTAPGQPNSLTAVIIPSEPSTYYANYVYYIG